MEKQKKTKEDFFVLNVFQAKNNSGLKAKLKRADVLALEYQCWGFFLANGINLDWNDQRHSAALVSAAIARSDYGRNGSLSLGQALAEAFKDKETGKVDRDSRSPALQRLRRLLACSSVEELIQVLRPLLALIDSRVNSCLDYALLLKQLWLFNLENVREKIKIEWTQDFYDQKGD